MSKDSEIEAKVDRVETIIDQLEAGEVSLAEAKALREEANEELVELEALLDVGDGSVTEYDASDA